MIEPSVGQYGGQMTTYQNMHQLFFDTQMIYLQDLTSNQIHSTPVIPAPAVLHLPSYSEPQTSMLECFCLIS